MKAANITQILNASGYTGCFFKAAEFKGITVDGDFCYEVTYYDDSGLGEDVGKVFVKYDHNTHAMTADF